MTRPSLKTLISAGLVFLLLLQLLRFLDLGCDNTVCHRNGYVLGARLFLGSLVLSAFGWCYTMLAIGRDRARPEFRLFTAIATGLTVLMTYVYLRSLFNQMVVDIPISRLEIFGLLLGLIGATGRLHRQRSFASTSLGPSGERLWWLEVALLVGLCVVIAGRELPREILLSSDPDLHAFMGKQIERFGGVPYQQHEWGPQGFNYPAGSGVMLFIWRLVAGMDQRDSLTALPILFTFFGGIIVAETLMTRVKHSLAPVLIFTTVIAVTAAGFLFPLYGPYAHMEGSARQLNILFVALFLGFVIDHVRSPNGTSGSSLVLPTMLVSLMMIMNPANIVVPSGLLFALAVRSLFTGDRQLKLAWVLLIGLPMAALDPFYHNLIGIAKEARVDTVIYAPHLVIKSLGDIGYDTLSIWLHKFDVFAHDIAMLLAEAGKPLFLILLAIYGSLAAYLASRSGVSKATLWAVAAFFISLYLVYGFAMALSSDRRYFLLSPYIYFNMSQFKAMFVVFLVAYIFKKTIDAGNGMLINGIVAVVLILPTYYVVRSEQDMLLDPRQAYCGAFECVALDDRVLLRKFEKLVKRGAIKNEGDPSPKVLIPNLESQSEIEHWIFPVGGGRQYPLMNVLPGAFYYYQGDVDYSTRSYLDHVCKQLDRPWLHAKGIQYIYLPAKRDEACVAGMEDLIQTEEVVLKEGNAYLLRFRAPGQ